jgi:hypothetical protein
MRLPATLEARLALIRSQPAVSHTRLALDRSMRSYDSDGRMRVATSVLTRACVSPYLGSEVPGGDDLGLDPRQTYNILRPIEELRKALPLFNSMPLLSEHTPVSAADHRPDLVIGSTGSDARIVGDTVTNSLVIWAKDGIDQVETGAAKALSCGYKYRAVARSGTFDGVPYTLVMADIEPNHLTICPEGRIQGAFVGDSALKTNRYNGRFTHDMSATNGSGLEALCEYLTSKGFSPEELDEVRGLMADPVEPALDTPPEFSGMPRVGGTMAEITKNIAQDAINRAKARQVDDFYKRHPDAMRLRNAR